MEVAPCRTAARARGSTRTTSASVLRAADGAEGERRALQSEGLAPDCRSPGWLVHCPHGGSDDDGNLVTLCAGCHRLLHDGRIAIRGTAPHALTFTVGRRADGSPREVYRTAAAEVA